MCSQDKNVASIRIFEKQAYCRLFIHGFAMAAIVKPIPVVHDFKLDARIQRVDAQRLWELLRMQSTEERQSLIPGNALLMDWMPYEVSLENLLLMQREEEMTFSVVLTEAGSISGISCCVRSQRLSGVHLFATIHVRGDEDLFQALALHSLATATHGCSHFVLTYDNIFRSELPPLPSEQAGQRDFRVPPVIEQFQQTHAQHLDFTADYVGGGCLVMEKSLE
eukprot:m.73339 g.73339  ORF g.73339 m.73339 type:complete len:222 (+) comp13889_c0_seq2:1058-1723(+)